MAITAGGRRWAVDNCDNDDDNNKDNDRNDTTSVRNRAERAQTRERLRYFPEALSYDRSGVTLPRSAAWA